ncbi:hypothetical protein MRX96_029198 [Rhipicephalus microplus]
MAKISVIVVVILIIITTISMAHFHWIAVVNATWFLATGGDVVGPGYLPYGVIRKRQPLRTLSLKTGDVLRLRCDSAVTLTLNATFIWLFQGLAIPPNSRPGLYRHKIVVARQAGRHPHATSSYSTLDMGHCNAAHVGIYTCQVVVEGVVADELHFEVRLTASTRREVNELDVSMHDPRPQHVPVALSLRGLPRRSLAAQTWWSSASKLVGQACDNDEVCADTDPVSLCEAGVCICAPTFTLEGTHCIKRVGRYHRCGAQVVCRGSSMICNEGFCECTKDTGDTDDECGSKDHRRTLSLIMIYSAIAIVLLAVVFILLYAFCQKRYDLNDDLKGAFIITCVIL